MVPEKGFLHQRYSVLRSTTGSGNSAWHFTEVNASAFCSVLMPLEPARHHERDSILTHQAVLQTGSHMHLCVYRSILHGWNSCLWMHITSCYLSRVRVEGYRSCECVCACLSGNCRYGSIWGVSKQAGESHAGCSLGSVLMEFNPDVSSPHSSQ